MTLTTGQPGKQNRKKEPGRPTGFTLLELILVMVVVSVVLAMTAPSLRGFARSRPIADTSAHLVTLADYARSQAVAEGRIYRLNVDAAKGLFWITAEAGGVFENLGREMGRTFSFPEGIQAEWLNEPTGSNYSNIPGLRLAGARKTGNAMETDGETFISFYPDGRTETASLRLVDQRENYLDIICVSPTDRFRVVTPEGDQPR